MKPENYVASILLLSSLALLSACQRPPVTATQLAAELNRRTTFPLDLGDGFRLDTITAEGNTIISTVTVSDLELSSDPRFRDVMHTATVSDICREITPAKQVYVDAGLSIAKVYKDTGGIEILRVDVRPAECG